MTPAPLQPILTFSKSAESCVTTLSCWSSRCCSSSRVLRSASATCLIILEAFTRHVLCIYGFQVYGFTNAHTTITTNQIFIYIILCTPNISLPVEGELHFLELCFEFVLFGVLVKKLLSELLLVFGEDTLVLVLDLLHSLPVACLQTFPFPLTLLQRPKPVIK